MLLPHLAALEAQEPPPIFHYTRDESLHGILSTGTLRLTDAFQLNDPTELTHGFNLLNDVFLDASKSAPPELALFGSRMMDFARKGGVRETAHYFVGSFSLLGDDLPQWRSYADDGRGFALEFNAARLERAFAQPQSGSYNTATFPVSYDESELRRMYCDLVQLAAPFVSLPRTRSMTKADRRAYLFDLEIRFTLAVLHRNVFFKNADYKSECEYRFLQIHQAVVGESVETEKRQRGGETVRFRALNWLAEAREALSAVVVGPASVSLPGPHIRAREWLDAAGLTNVPIRDSKLHYRAF